MSGPGSGVPPHTLEGLKAYRDTGLPTGDFLEAVLSNDLKEACGRADVHNQRAIFEIVSWCYNEMPSAAWGSPEKVAAWLGARDKQRSKEKRETMTTATAKIEKPTEAEYVEHVKRGLPEDKCLVCDSELWGSWTDYNGEIKCDECGMAYQILGCHLKEEWLAAQGLKEEDIAQKYCPDFEGLPVERAYWKETGNQIPIGSFFLAAPPWTKEEQLDHIRWLWANRDRLRPQFDDTLNWEVIEKNGQPQ